MINKVFISYASEDYDFATQIFEQLENKGFKPWMDKHKLLPGQKWEGEINEQLKQSDFIIIILSATSVSKRGFVQKEFKTALKYAEERLNSDIYIIPIKLNECIIPQELTAFNWLEFKADSTFEQIFNSINFQRNKIISSLSKDAQSLSNYKEENIVLSSEMNKYLNYSIQYPVFTDTVNVNTEVLNIEIKSYINKQVSRIYNDMIFDYEYEISKMEFNKLDKIDFEISFTVGIANEEIVSIMFREYTNQRLSHPNYVYNSINVGFNPNVIYGPNFISSESDLENKLKNYVHELFGNKYPLPNYLLQNINKSGTEEYFMPEDFEYIITKDFIELNFSNYLEGHMKNFGVFQFKYEHKKGMIYLK